MTVHVSTLFLGKDSHLLQKLAYKIESPDGIILEIVKLNNNNGNFFL